MIEKANVIGGGTVAGALEYLDFLSSKGHVAPGAIKALRTGFAKVMKTLGGEDWEKIEVRGINVEDYMARFANMTHGQYNANSLVDYKSRVKKVTSWYLQFLAKPGWTPETKPRARKIASNSSATTDSGSTESTYVKSTNPSQASLVSESVAVPARSNLVAFPFPLADGTLATLYLPQSITTSDADRMARFVKTLVIDEGDGNV
jgi:hypothetical protein